MNRTSISWVRNPDGTPGFTWNPLAGCSPASAGCSKCYAARLAATRLAHLPQYAGLAYVDDAEDDAKGRVLDRYHWTGEVRFFPEKLAEPLRRKKPARVFVGDMGDLFHPQVAKEQIAAVFGVMAACSQHKFFVLTKRAARMRGWFEWAKENTRTSLPNVALGVTVENQKAADERIPEPLQTPAAMRFLSIEPVLEHIDLSAFMGGEHVVLPGDRTEPNYNFGIDWVIVGGESGPHARPCQVEWIRSIVRQCKDAGVPCFVKQLGAYPVFDDPGEKVGKSLICPNRRNPNSDPAEWPEDLRVRQWPEGWG